MISYNPDPTYLGQCSANTKKGSRCQHWVIFVNGKCKQHGGETPPEYAKEIQARAEQKFAERKARLLKRVDRFNRRFGL